MIKKIKLNQVATFSNEVIIDDLRKVNFFYGSNGTGKTTITKVIPEPDKYPKCKIEWDADRKLKILVFNEDFIREYFYEKDNLFGIYTLDKEAKNIEEKIKDKTQQLNGLLQEQNQLKMNKDSEEQKKNNLFNQFQEKCWKEGYLELQNDFDEFFTGYKKDKKKFANEILDTELDESKLQEKDKLQEKYKLIYGERQELIDELPLIANELIGGLEILENDQNILDISIIGKKDVNITKMIEKLHNHDWIKQGKEYYDRNYDEKKKVYICPFCQQTTSEEFRKQLEEYFDETYKQNINKLKEYQENYKSKTENIKRHLDKILEITNNKYLNEEKDKLQDKYKVIESIVNQNLQLLEKKYTNPSLKIQIKNIYKNLTEINEIIENINNRIKDHNSIIKDKKNNKVILDEEIWNYIIYKLQKDILDYNDNKTNVEKSIENLNNQINEKENIINKIKDEIGKLEKGIKSVKPTVDAINKILKSFGFKGFKLETTEDEKHYCIKRDDGSDAKKTLSEGEKNFLIFLYFYHLIYGVDNPEENINQDKILVIDDPVSSFDSDVLFIVSTLIKNILKRVRAGQDSVKQVFIFTHNAYFFKEVTFISSRESCYNKRLDTIYYIVRKKNNISFLEKYEINPIKTSYQLLWDDIRNENIDCVSKQNSMRRIIEFYFKFLASLNENDLIDKFNGEEKNICQCLISWINVGSHEIIDDINFSISQENFDKFLEIFKKIFEYTGHISHYNMMMKINEESN
ncbi:MAG: AAA family ATPase [Candidatus Goldbacteria bacterium]|nr:AAA family ATPase [Candidatus Goldiibacteriota bacterium]